MPWRLAGEHPPWPRAAERESVSNARSDSTTSSPPRVAPRDRARADPRRRHVAGHLRARDDALGALERERADDPGRRLPHEERGGQRHDAGRRAHVVRLPHGGGRRARDDRVVPDLPGQGRRGRRRRRRRAEAGRGHLADGGRRPHLGRQLQLHHGRRPTGGATRRTDEHTAVGDDVGEHEARRLQRQPAEEPRGTDGLHGRAGQLPRTRLRHDGEQHRLRVLPHAHRHDRPLLQLRPRQLRDVRPREGRLAPFDAAPERRGLDPERHAVRPRPCGRRRGGRDHQLARPDARLGAVRCRRDDLRGRRGGRAPHRPHGGAVADPARRAPLPGLSGRPGRDGRRVLPDGLPAAVPGRRRSRRHRRRPGPRRGGQPGRRPGRVPGDGGPRGRVGDRGRGVRLRRHADRGLGDHARGRDGEHRQPPGAGRDERDPRGHGEAADRAGWHRRNRRRPLHPGRRGGRGRAPRLGQRLRPRRTSATRTAPRRTTRTARGPSASRRTARRTHS